MLGLVGWVRYTDNPGASINRCRVEYIAGAFPQIASTSNKVRAAIGIE